MSRRRVLKATDELKTNDQIGYQIISVYGLTRTLVIRIETYVRYDFKSKPYLLPS